MRNRESQDDLGQGTGAVDDGNPVARHEPGDTPAERTCRRLVCWLLPVIAVIVASRLYVTNYGEDTLLGRQTELLRPDGFGVLAGYACVLAFGAVALASVALTFRPRNTRWVSGLIFLLLSAAWGLLVWHLALWLEPYFPTLDLTRKSPYEGPSVLYPTIIAAALFPPAAVVLSGKLFQRTRTDIAGVSTQFRARTAGEVFLFTGVLCSFVGGGFFLFSVMSTAMWSVGLGWWLEGPVGFVALGGAMVSGGLIALGGFFAVREFGTRLKFTALRKASWSGQDPKLNKQSLWLMLGVVPAAGFYWALSTFIAGIIVRPMPDWLVYVFSGIWFFAQLAAVPKVLGWLQPMFPDVIIPVQVAATSNEAEPTPS